MFETAKRLFDELKDVANAMAPGLKNIGHDVGKEIERLVEHGAAEGASLLNTGSAFVQYGSGQHRPDLERDEHSQDQSQGHSQEHTQDQSHEMHLERDGHER
jgi:hypothetical protein